MEATYRGWWAVLPVVFMNEYPDLRVLMERAKENMSAIRRAVEEEAVAHDMLFSKLLGDLQIICKNGRETSGVLPFDFKPLKQARSKTNARFLVPRGFAQVLPFIHKTIMS